MDTFENLPFEKRQRVINAAMTEFGTHGYNKASVSDIARSAGISKAMVFTYFGSKSKCYEYMCNEMFRISSAIYEQSKAEIFDEIDYIDRQVMISRIKIKMLKQYPTLTKFSLSMFRETATEVRPIIDEILQKAYEIQQRMADNGLEKEKLVYPEDAEQLTKALSWIAYGCVEEWAQTGYGEVEQALEKYDKCILTLKKYFYKEEYLKNDGN